MYQKTRCHYIENKTERKHLSRNWKIQIHLNNPPDSSCMDSERGSFTTVDWLRETWKEHYVSMGFGEVDITENLCEPIQPTDSTAHKNPAPSVAGLPIPNGWDSFCKCNSLLLTTWKQKAKKTEKALERRSMISNDLGKINYWRADNFWLVIIGPWWNLSTSVQTLNWSELVPSFLIYFNKWL